MKSLLLSFFILFTVQIVNAQEKAELLKNLNSEIDTVRIDALNELCWYYKYSHPDSAFYYGDLALEASEEQAYDYGLAKAYNNIAIVYWGRASYDTAVLYLDSARSFYVKMNFAKGICSSLINSGLLKQSLADIPGALEDLLRALRIQEEHQFEGYLAPILNNIGNCYFIQEDYEESKKWFTRSYLEKLRINDPRIFSTAMNMGTCFQRLLNYDSALWYYNKALPGALDNEAWINVQEILLNIGSVYVDTKDYPKAIDFLRRSESIDSLTDNALNLNFVYLRLSEVYRLMNELDKAEGYASEALDIGMNLKNNSRIEGSYFELYAISKKRGDFDEALQYFELRTQFRDSVLSVEKDQYITELATKYETEKKEQQLQLLTTERELQQAEVERSKYLLWGITSFSLIALLAIVLFFSRHRYKLKASLAEEKERLQKSRFKMVIDAEEKERKRIARELHDGLGQLLSTARITVSSLEESTKVQNSLKVIDMAVNEVRSISHNMMPNSLMNVGLKAALEDMIRKIDESGSVHASFILEGEINVPESISVTVYRVVQEVINNALKYAEASSLTLKVISSDLGLQIEVNDDGKGFDTSKIEESTGIGWTNIFSRMELIGGRVTVDSKIGKGTSVGLVLPDYSAGSRLAS